MIRRGRNLIIEGRHAGGRPENLPDLAAELARLGVTDRDNHHARDRRGEATTSTIPVVRWTSAPRGYRPVASLARPGGNVTGLSIASSEIGGKAIGVLEVVPRSPDRGRGSPANLAHDRLWADRIVAGPGVDLAPIDAHPAADLDRAFSDLGQHPTPFLSCPFTRSSPTCGGSLTSR
jgi:hypothetical protein